MEQQSLGVITGYIFIDLLFSFIAACVAFGITYNEYVHHYPTRKEPLKYALSTATFTFIVFLAIGIMGVIALHWMS
jgi:inner membrane protein involved in colicin E2 resistance